MEELQKKHRQEQKDLQSRVTQKKKQATKKTRKGVNDECTELERQLKERQAGELKALSVQKDDTDEETSDEEEPAPEIQLQALNEPMQSLSLSSPAPSSGNDQVKKPSRQKARLARRAAEQEAAVEEARKEAADLPDLREKERARMREAYEPKGLTEQEIRSDGHCLYAAVADQLDQSGISLAPSNVDVPEFDKSPATLRYKATRQSAASYIAQHSDDFVPFLEEPLDQYVKTIRETGEWGGHLEILALAKAYGVDINVLQGDGRVETVSCGGESEKKALWLAYYRHSYGLGEHYNSLRQAEP